MAFISQTYTLLLKNLKIIIIRNWFWTFIRALAFPIVLAAVVCQAKHWISPDAEFGFGPAFPIRSLGDALDASSTSRSNVAFVTDGFRGGDVELVINNLTTTLQTHGKTVHRLDNTSSVTNLCAGNLQGSTNCYGSVIFRSSPDHPGPNPIWNYTMLADSSLGGTPNVNNDNTDMNIYTLPFQRAIDAAIVSTNASAMAFPAELKQYAFTSYTQAEHDRQVSEEFQAILSYYLLVVFFIAIYGITFHMVGFIVSEREQGLTQLIDTMIAGGRWYHAQTARFLAAHLAFDIVYIPAWIVVGALLGHYAYPSTGSGYSILVHLLAGLALSSASLFMASFFKRAQLSGVTAVIVALVLAIAAQYGITPYTGTNGLVYAMGFLFPPMTYIFALEVNGFYEINQQPLQWNVAPPTYLEADWSWSISASTFLGFFVVQIIVYPMLASLVERLIYGVSSHGRTVVHGKDQPYAVQTQNLYVEYKGRKPCCKRRQKPVRAVQDASLNWLPGSITVLLGVNGSGKSTMLNAISGLKSIESGTVQVDGTGGFGLCPQNNVMWPALTVYEHVQLFSKLKSTSGQKVARSEILDLIAACDLKTKVSAKSKTLSGGQKRKLQLAMMFAGGSRVCCIDEVSSGIDPLARRKIWDILLAERHTRSILLTTHYLEEADVLADHIAIMSKGHVKAQGSAVELKARLGGGYRVIVDRRLPESSINLGNVSRPVYEGHQTIYQTQDSAGVASLLLELERKGIHDYRVQEPTTENVFFKMAEELQEDSVVQDHPMLHARTKFGSDASGSTAAGSQAPLDLTSGHGTTVGQQTWILFKKRITILGSSYMPYIAALLIPLCTAGLVTLFFRSISYKNGLQCSDGRSNSIGYTRTISPSIFSYNYALWGPQDRFNTAPLYASVPRLTPQNTSRIQYQPSLTAFNDLVHKNASRLYYGGFYNDPVNPVIAYQFNSGSAALSGSLTLQNIANQIITQVPIAFSYAPFGSAAVPKDTNKTIQLAIYMGLALCAYPALFALYPQRERKRGVRALHYSNGIRSGPLWVAYFLFDFIFVLLVSILIPVIWTTKWNGFFALGYLFVVLMLYGLTSIAFSYCVSLFVGSQLAAFAASAGIQVLFMIIYFASYITSQAYAPPDQLQNWLNYEYFTICLITPAGNMLRALLISVNSFFILCRGPDKISYPGEITAYGGPILYLLCQLFVLLAFLAYWDAGGRMTIFRRKQNTSDVETELEGKYDETDEAMENPTRLKASNEGVQVYHVTKRFGSNTALEDVTFGMQRSETLALLGPNGAGKSTLISVMRGDIRPSDRNGNVVIEGSSILNQRTAARSQLGVCGQFDAMDSMTVQQQLRFYATARGVPKSDIEKNVSEVMRAFNLKQYANRVAGKLSGGNQRKLSLGCAIVGGPTVLLLDEPSSGMDPAAKRVLWSQLAYISTGRVMLLSTHSMEEADALCQRAAILARRMLAIGTTESLRERHGALHVHVVHKDAPHASQQSMDALKDWITQTLPTAKIEDRTYHGQLRFSMPLDSTFGEQGLQSSQNKRPVAGLFNLMEQNREQLGIAYYAIGRTTLDDVFLSVVRRHNVEEENYRNSNKKEGLLGRLLKRG